MQYYLFYNGNIPSPKTYIHFIPKVYTFKAKGIYLLEQTYIPFVFYKTTVFRIPQQQLQFRLLAGFL